jgi:protein gp37
MQLRFSSTDNPMREAKQIKTHPKMFDAIDKTWNPVIGCLHNCCYCWARRLAETRLKNTVKYREGFKPKLAHNELNKKFKNRFVFACDMADLFGDWVPEEWILDVLATIEKNPTSSFLLLTKNPKRYEEFLDIYPENLVLGATIETNRDYAVSNASPTVERYKNMAELPFKNKLISIEPIMDFDLDIFTQWLKEIGPTIVYVGYDNYNNGLPEPSLSKTKQLIEKLEAFTRVRVKTLRENRGN